MIFFDMESSLKENTLYHIYNRGNWKATVFHDEEDHRVFRNILRRCFYSRYFDLITICIIPNHYHFVVTQRGNANISETMFRVGVLYTRHYNKKYETAGHVFQGSFQTKPVKTSKYFKDLITYIEENPRKANLSDKGYYKWIYRNEMLVNYYSLQLENFLEDEVTDSI